MSFFWGEVVIRSPYVIFREGAEDCTPDLVRANKHTLYHLSCTSPLLGLSFDVKKKKGSCFERMVGSPAVVKTGNGRILCKLCPVFSPSGARLAGQQGCTPTTLSSVSPGSLRSSLF